LYWVIKGFVLVRQRVLDLRPDAKDDGTACCGIVLDKELVATRAHPRRAFQGWRYLEVADAPKDAGVVDAPVEAMPGGMRDELGLLRLIDWSAAPERWRSEAFCRDRLRRELARASPGRTAASACRGRAPRHSRRENLPPGA